jgi:hypothetical protein
MQKPSHFAENSPKGKSKGSVPRIPKNGLEISNQSETHRMVDPLTQLFRKRLQFVPVDLGISHLDVFFKLPHAHAHNNLFF